MKYRRRQKIKSYYNLRYFLNLIGYKSVISLVDYPIID